MKVARIETRELGINVREHHYAKLARKHFQISLLGAEAIQVFWLKAKSGIDLPAEEVQLWTQKIFADPVLQDVAHSMDSDFKNQGGVTPSFVVQVRFLPGVTDNVGKTATEALALFSAFARSNEVVVYTGKTVYLYGEISKSEAEKIAFEALGNSIIEDVQVFSWSQFRKEDRFEDQQVPEVHLEESLKVEAITLPDDAGALEKLSKENFWALTAQEMQTVRGYFDRPEVKKRRLEHGLPAVPTDVEMEVLAQTWSEHCKHKIFAAEIDYTEVDDEKGQRSWKQTNHYPSLGAFTVNSVFKSYIRKCTQEIQEERKLPWLVSVFTDNAGVVRFDSKVDVCVKVETHNSPSALDPYGGALTGIVGVNRDVLGCGLGARPIANTDVFCFGQPDWPGVGEEKELPEGLKHPRRIFDGVHLGVEDGGNKSGIPTVNGAFAFHRDFCGKPLVFCGTIGVLPETTKAGLPGSSKNQKPGDLIVMVGGRIGKDGIHGATFSSMELTSGAPATVVQIGDPITQKRAADFLLEARDLGLFTSVTDNGAGGLSSSVGEMATGTGGARLDVTHAPVKYPGLKPFELVVSESQERMTFSVHPSKIDAFLALAKRRGAEATVLGEFNDSGFFRIEYQGEPVAEIDMDFLHHGLPPMVLKAKWEGPKDESSWGKKASLPEIKDVDMLSRSFHENALFKLLARWNIRSKEEWVRRYDHEVQASTLIKPFVGVEAKGPGDAAVIWMAPHGGEDLGGLAISCGLNPKLSRFDAYVSAQHAFDEAVRNSVAVGGDPDIMAVVDNFCWPDPLPSERNPDAQHKLAQLVRANHGLYDLAKKYGSPFVSGKDSMKNDFIGRSRFGKELKISVPPTILVTAIAKVHDVSKTVTSDFKSAGDFVFLLGRSEKHLGGSELEDCYELPSFVSKHPPILNAEESIRLYRTLHKAINAGLIRSAHDCSEGGLLVALAESAIGGMIGFESELENLDAELKEFSGNLAEFFFNESPGRFVVSVSPEKVEEFKKLFSGQFCMSLGTVKSDVLRMSRHGLVVLDVPVKEAKKAWRGER